MNLLIRNKIKKIRLSNHNISYWMQTLDKKINLLPKNTTNLYRALCTHSLNSVRNEI